MACLCSCWEEEQYRGRFHLLDKQCTVDDFYHITTLRFFWPETDFNSQYTKEYMRRGRSPVTCAFSRLGPY